MEKKTYGAPRLVDWVAQIKAGAATVRVHFTGGALTAYGVTPAEYTTDNPFIQKVIEQSKYFKEGRIILLRKSEVPVLASSAKMKKYANPVEHVVKQMPPATIHTEEVTNVDSVEEKTADDVAEVNNETLTQVEASCLQDAQAYLQENYNIASYKVRSYDAAQRAASEHGIKFVGAKFDTLESDEQNEAETTE